MRTQLLEKYLRLGEYASRIIRIISLILLVLITSTVADAAKPTKWTVKATAGPNGTISPSSKTVNSGSRTNFTVTPNA
ncbi:MAG TPA: hypothetical protein VLD55_12075 [Candidatus Sulfobium mesophilum]|nr:hypothetical protein [Candidatus Sulfobium mesophilum]